MFYVILAVSIDDRLIQYLEENLGGANVRLSAEELQEVRAVAEQADAAHGDRYPSAWMSFLFGDTPAL